MCNLSFFFSLRPRTPRNIAELYKWSFSFSLLYVNCRPVVWLTLYDDDSRRAKIHIFLRSERERKLSARVRKTKKIFWKYSTRARDRLDAIFISSHKSSVIDVFDLSISLNIKELAYFRGLVFLWFAGGLASLLANESTRVHVKFTKHTR